MLPRRTAPQEPGRAAGPIGRVLTACTPAFAEAHVEAGRRRRSRARYGGGTSGGARAARGWRRPPDRSRRCSRFPPQSPSCPKSKPSSATSDPPCFRSRMGGARSRRRAPRSEPAPAAPAAAARRRAARRAKRAVIVLDGLRLIVQPGMTGSLVVHQRPATGEDAQYAVLRTATTTAGSWSTATCAASAPCSCWTTGSGRLLRGDRPRPNGHGRERLGLALRARGGEEGDPEGPRRRREHLRQRGAVRRRDRPVQARAAAHADQHVRLHREIRRILGQAIASSGTTFRTPAPGPESRATSSSALYGREGEPCPGMRHPPSAHTHEKSTPV